VLLCKNCSVLINIIYTFGEMIKSSKRIYVALPVMDEIKLLPSCLASIESQSYSNCHVVICINQPEAYWALPEKKHICENNEELLLALAGKSSEKYTIIDKSSKGLGWQVNKMGVGWARKTIMDSIAARANKDDIILSLDADTAFNNNYFESVISVFNKEPKPVALSNPYYHNLCGSEAEDKAILRYEIYMRNYAINMMLIRSPYAFTALGSAIALPVSSYKAIGGMTPKLSGEDFYFLQKLRKYGNIRVYNEEKVHPAARFSDRVFFGTGPAMIKGNMGDWASYPVYHSALFENIRNTYDCFPGLFKEDIQTPLTGFFCEQFRSDNIWQALRENHRDVDHFVRACHEKLDGLRILQYLKAEQSGRGLIDEHCLYENISNTFSRILNFEKVDLLKDLNFKECSVALLDEIRNYLVKVEEILQKKCETI